MHERDTKEDEIIVRVFAGSGKFMPSDDASIDGFGAGEIPRDQFVEIRERLLAKFLPYIEDGKYDEYSHFINAYFEEHPEDLDPVIELMELTGEIPPETVDQEELQAYVEYAKASLADFDKFKDVSVLGKLCSSAVPGALLAAKYTSLPDILASAAHACIKKVRSCFVKDRHVPKEVKSRGAENLAKREESEKANIASRVKDVFEMGACYAVGGAPLAVCDAALLAYNRFAPDSMPRLPGSGSIGEMLVSASIISSFVESMSGEDLTMAEEYDKSGRLVDTVAMAVSSVFAYTAIRTTSNCVSRG